MKANKKIMIAGIIFVSILGFTGHFFYEWSGKNPLIGLFFPTNESTWEHMKLIFFPMLLFIPISLALYPQKQTILPAMLAGTIFGTMLIPILFYTYKGILGFNLSSLDISVFFVSVILSFLLISNMYSPLLGIFEIPKM